MSWVRDAGERRGLLGFEKRALRRVEKTLFPSIPEGVFPRRFFPEESAIRRKRRSTTSYAPLDKAENWDNLLRFSARFYAHEQ